MAYLQFPAALFSTGRIFASLACDAASRLAAYGAGKWRGPVRTSQGSSTRMAQPGPPFCLWPR